MARTKSRRPLLATLLGLAAFVALGCRDDEIRRYQAPKPEKQDPAHSDRPAVRLLGAIFPHDDRTWFFKLMGPAHAVAGHEEAFDRFVRSVRFTNKADQPIAWTVPEGWQQDAGGKELRYATFRLGPKDSPLELTVTRLGREGEAASVLANVNRWRGQLGLKSIGEAELAKVCKEEVVAGVRMTRVDLATGDPVPRLKYNKPDGWQEQTDPRGLRVALFKVAEKDQSAEVSVMPLPGEAGGLRANVNRWREQIKLGPVSEEQLRKEAGQIDVAGVAAPYVDLLGPESAGPQRQRTLGVVHTRGKHTWFFKMTGPSELVAKQKPAFEAFLKSVQFDGGRGANDE